MNAVSALQAGLVLFCFVFPAESKVSKSLLCVRISFLSFFFFCHFSDIFSVYVNRSLAFWNQTKCLIKKRNEYSFVSHFFHLNPKEAGVGGDKMINGKATSPDISRDSQPPHWFPRGTAVHHSEEDCATEGAGRGAQQPGLSTLYITPNYFSNLTHISKILRLGTNL